MHKILSVGMMLLLSTACFPHLYFLPEKTRPDTQITAGTSTSLFTPLELEHFSSPESALSQTEQTASSSPLPASSLWVAGLELPVTEESSDDFKLEVLTQDPPKKEPQFDIPIVVNAKVEHFIRYFQTTLKNTFSNFLARSEKYIPFMKTLLKENGLPEDLVYLALIESGFNPYAYSRSKASGPWQFIYPTGIRYGLKVNYWVDERRDPEKSTVAAARYLKDLYDMFACWYLAAAGYNAGENKIANAMKRYRTEDFWELSKYSYLKKETRDYVPQIIAAALLAKDPEKYGFVNIDYQDPLRYEKVKVPEVMSLDLIAKACEIPLRELKDLNPELSRWCTPPDGEYEIKIPFGSKELFLKNFEALQPLKRFQFKTHIVRKGDTFGKIARSYRVELAPLLEINRMKKNSRLSVGMNLLIPIPASKEAQSSRTAKKGTNEKDLPSGVEEITYTIKKGDSLWSIANEMGVNIDAISRWNSLPPEKKLIPGEKLKIRMTNISASSNIALQRKGEKELIYVVKVGDSLWSIAQMYNVTVPDIKAWNDLDGKDKILPSDQLKLRVSEYKSSMLN